ncbi:MarR family transcriptional regulator [Methanothermococcus okinawensis]|uniref:Regulatory protein MarR n=1 Tax=Methanothermococcus okinawensis (strain DSM 14208 / JCM 11175 / IH1) TaxID=647113 RepID=F8AKD7_METOI|nr:helix-turn-helix domain-containing protein [Methanothermococcus okinawensis]AEH06337.1 regulatory protein MarR [Methanothermococcus okinawensis IH1]
MSNYKFKGVLLVFLVLFGVFNVANAIKFESYNITCNIDQDNKVHEIIFLDIYNNNSKDIDDITYIIPQNAYNLKVYSDRGIGSFSKNQNEGSTEIITKLKNPIKKGERGYLKIVFDSDIVWDKGTKKLLSISVPAVDSNFSMVIKLPPGAAVVSPAEGLLSITPQDYIIDTDGKQIFIKWKRKLSESEKYFTATVSYTILSSSYNQTTPSTSYTNNIYYNILIVILILLAGALLYGIIYEKKKNTAKTKYITELSIKKEELVDELNNLKSKIGILESENNIKDDHIKELMDKNKELNNKLDELILKINKLEMEIKDKEDIIKKLKDINNELSNNIDYYKNEISTLNSKIDELNELYNKEMEEIDELNKYSENIISEKEKTITKLKNKINEYEQTILNLKNTLNEYEKTKGEMLMSILTEEEKMIIKLIREYKEITQKEIVELTGLTKPKVSRIVSDLEGRGIIKKVKIGRINKLTLSDELDGWLN